MHSLVSALASANTLVNARGAEAAVALVQTPQELFKDVKFSCALGAGGFGTVYNGTYEGGAAAIKLVAMKGNKSDWREGLVSPQLRHPHVVNTMCVRAALVTPEFLEEVFATPSGPQPDRSSAPQLPAFRSGDGLGNPRKMAAADERRSWQEVLNRVGVVANTRLLVLVQELCDLGSLSRAVRQGRFRPREGRDGVPQHVARRMLLRTAAEICRGMIHLHGANVIHGDVKPSNVLLARSHTDRRGFIAKVADFGLARLLQPNANCIQSKNCGTAAYCSPEGFNGVFSKKSDVYSFGVLLWEMLTGERPFEKTPAGLIMIGVCFKGMRPPWPDLDWPELCAWGRRCLAHEPDERPDFRQLEEALVALEEALRAESVSQRQSEEGARSGSRPRLPPSASHSRQRLTAATSAAASADAAAAALPPPPPTPSLSAFSGAGDSHASSVPAAAPHAGAAAAGGGGRLTRSYPDIQVAAPARGVQFDSLDSLMSPWTAVAAPPVP